MNMEKYRLCSKAFVWLFYFSTLSGWIVPHVVEILPIESQNGQLKVFQKEFPETEHGPCWKPVIFGRGTTVFFLNRPLRFYSVYTKNLVGLMRAAPIPELSTWLPGGSWAVSVVPESTRWFYRTLGLVEPPVRDQFTLILQAKMLQFVWFGP